MTDTPRLIEFAFPLKQASLDSVHEKNVRHGHISTLHIWPARRPLAACRAALIATLLPDPGTAEKRQELCEKIGGKVVKRIERKKMPGGQIVEREKEETEGGILHWGRETENADTLQWFRDEIKKAYGGRAPKVLDPFAGGGAIPLEAMRLGCEATAVDINPVAWFILKCTLEYPQKLAGQKRPLPAFILQNRDFMEAFFKAQGHSKAEIRALLKKLGTAVHDDQQSFDFEKSRNVNIDADLAWHVRAWGQWVLDRARRELARFYPVYADFEPLDKGKSLYEPQPMRLVPLKDDGTPDIDAINGEFSADYLSIKSNPRWVAKPTVAYLWARTVTCKNCRATIPLLKTRWLCRNDRKRVLLAMNVSHENNGVVFGIEANVPIKGANAAQRREEDRRLGVGTMTRAGAKCPSCATIMKGEDIRFEGQNHRLGRTMTCVVIETEQGKGYRLPTTLELDRDGLAQGQVDAVFADIPFNVPQEPIPRGASRVGGGSAFSAQPYGLTEWHHLFTPRQLLALGTFVRLTRATAKEMGGRAYPERWIEAVVAMLALAVDRLADRGSSACSWTVGWDKIRNTFTRFALPITWDFAESVPTEDSSGGYPGALEWISLYLEHAMKAAAIEPIVVNKSALTSYDSCFDVVVTDPPYYDAIPYSDLMDFFYVWLRRVLSGINQGFDMALSGALSPKWDRNREDGELVDDSGRHDGDRQASKRSYETGMYRAFEICFRSLTDDGRFVVVFAHKEPDAWETLVTAIIRAGFIVDASWPVKTEMSNRTRAHGSAALASSVWLICKKRASAARPGWDNKVLEEMRLNIARRLREFWDAGIRGPDFVWAATGPALEAYSKHPVVKIADDPGKTLTVTEFLNHARRMVVDFVVGRVLGCHSIGGSSHSVEKEDEAAVDRLDELSAYYLLHRNDFGLDEAPVGACILYATACGLSDDELLRDWDLLAKTGRDAPSAEADGEEADSDDEPVEEPGSGSKVKLKAWNHRRGRSLGYEAPRGRPVPLIDRIHRLMQLWKAGDVYKVDEYLDEHGLRRHELFRRVLQSLIELAKAGSEERSLLESLSNHIGAKGARKPDPQKTLIAASAEQEGEEA
jgi:putative DNA methylase